MPPNSDRRPRDLISTAQAAAEYPELTVRKLRSWRATRRGPTSYRVGGRVFWSRADLDAIPERRQSLAPLGASR